MDYTPEQQAIVISKEEFFTHVFMDDTLKKEITGDIEYMHDVDGGVYYAYDVDEDIHYFFV